MGQYGIDAVCRRVLTSRRCRVSTSLERLVLAPTPTVSQRLIDALPLLLDDDGLPARRSPNLMISATHAFEEALTIHQQHLRETMEAAAPPPPYMSAPESVHGSQAMIDGDLAYGVMSRPPYTGEQ